MKNRLRLVLFLSLLLILFVTGAALAAPVRTIDWWVIAGGGGYTESTDEVYTLNGTIGQPVAGVASIDLCSGFWCGLTDWLGTAYVYLPFISRE
jgi:hypothetical protein